MIKSRMQVTAVLALGLAMTACSKDKPTGQVVANVNGDEISSIEFYQEMAHFPGGQSVDEGARRAALNGLIERKLLARYARDQKLDQSPAFVAELHRAQETLLAQAAVSAMASAAVAPEPQEVDAFIAQHPELAQHTVFQVDQIAFARPKDHDIEQQIEAAPTLDAIQDILKGASLPGQRVYASWDSAAMPPAAARQFAGDNGMKPLIIANGEAMVAGVRLGQRVVTLEPQEQRAIAARALQQRAAQGRVGGWLKSARQSAKITYGADFAPLAKPPTIPAAPAKPK